MQKKRETRLVKAELMKILEMLSKSLVITNKPFAITTYDFKLPKKGVRSVKKELCMEDWETVSSVSVSLRKQ